MKAERLAIVLMLALCGLLRAQLDNSDQATHARCAEYLRTSLPAVALTVLVPTAWPDCDSYKSYSGIGRKVDFDAARQCAWRERLAQQAGLEPRYTVASVFGGSAMLSTLFANGKGVSRNLLLAIRFACEAGGAPAEISIRVEHLESLAKQTSNSSSTFDFCDDITSGFMEGFCAGRSNEIQKQKRAATLDILVSSFTPAQRGAFAVLRRLEDAYSVAHAQGEIDLSGTARAMYQVDAEETLRDDFLTALETFEAGKFPTGSTAQYADADAQLNTAYRKALSDASAHKDDYGAVQPQGIRDAERAWLKYRDAWVAFAKLRYPASQRKRGLRF